MKGCKMQRAQRMKKNTDIFILFSFSIYVEFLMLLKKIVDIGWVLKIHFERIK